MTENAERGGDECTEKMGEMATKRALEILLNTAPWV